MLEFVVSDEIFSLGAFAAAGSSEEEEDVWFGELSVGVLFVLG